MRESAIERHLVAQVKQHGGLCWKITSPNLRGVPDRLVITPTALVWVELKAPGKKLGPLQRRRHAELARLGQAVHVLDSIHAVDELIKTLWPQDPSRLALTKKSSLSTS